VADTDVQRAIERHERLRLRKQRKRQLREIERKLKEGCYDEDDWLDDERELTLPSPNAYR
jgi:hypothetical protein